MDKKRYQVSEGRKTLYYIGMALMVLGVVLFISVFFTMMNADPFSPPTFSAPIIGFVLIIIGSVLMGIGRMGLAGSGVVLDPVKAREDLEPYARMGGGMISDALEEVDALRPSEVIKIRCPNCQALNDENDRFCGSCGQALKKDE